MSNTADKQITDFPPQYDPRETEGRTYKLWEESGFFNPDNLPGERVRAFTIVVPPPNITGSLHMGHALNVTIQDILIRKKRMEGYRTLWLPGTDHAGIATQNAVEKNLKKEGISRHDLGREKFVKKIWEWKETYGHIILDQFKRLGSSMDWSRTRFTMDEPYKKTVEETFIHYYKKGWMYRAERVINWCTRCQTSLSDLELEYKEDEATLYYMKYPLADDPKKFVTVATVRPETMLGDSAVAVNPNDGRYKKLIGKEILLPLQNREIPIIADEKIDMNFGTGAVKVTPAHDMLDAEIGEKNKLPLRKVINEYGKMTETAGKICEGLKAGECREKVVLELKNRGLIEKEEPYRHNIAICYRCGTIIEPIPNLQWFLKMSELAKPALKAIGSRDVAFHPDRWKEVSINWLENIKDWNISRQIWWGHKIPVAYCVSCGEVRLKPKIKSNWFFVRHGETDWNVQKRTQGQSGNAPLNETGRAQAASAAKVLKAYPIDLVISSDLARAKETAEIIARETGVEVSFDERLRERNYGVLEGLTREEVETKGLAQVREKLHGNRSNRPEGGESWNDVEARILDLLHHHKKEHHHKNIVIVSHGATLLILFHKLKNMHIEETGFAVLRNAEILNIAITEESCACGSDFVEEETDVLDTWFSSALWPFATLGWPENSPALKEFYPTRVLSTARDIINLWVARMVFSGLEFMKEKPFSDVIIHATILTKDGKRMSKSLGTGVDPMTLIEKYGADATRFGLIWQAMGGQDIHWSEEHVMAGKKFANKLWNASRFVLQDSNVLETGYKKKPEAKTEEDKKILASFKIVKTGVSKDIDAYEFGQALHSLYEFFWHEFCDIYVEKSKDQKKDASLRESTNRILFYVLCESIKLFHPFLPFVTEEIWSRLPLKDKKMLFIEDWPKIE